MLLGIMVGGSSSIVVFGLVTRLSLSDETKALLSLESDLTDILATIAAFALFGIMIANQFDVAAVAGNALRSIIVGLVLGVGVGIPWILISSRITKSAHAYMFTLAVLFVLFFLAKSMGESGALTALVFGLTLGNGKLISKYLKIKSNQPSTDNTFHNQLTFLVRTFFFVFIGLLANLGRIEYILFGIVMTLGIYFGRLAITKYSLLLGTNLAKMSFLRIPSSAWKEREGVIPSFDRRVVGIMLPRGLAAAVLATIPLTLNISNADVYPQVVFVVIISSVVLTTVGLTAASKRQPSNVGIKDDDAQKYQEV